MHNKSTNRLILLRGGGDDSFFFSRSIFFGREIKYIQSFHSFTITRVIPCAQFFLRILGEATMKIYFLLYKLTQNLQLGIIDRYQWGHVHISHCYVDGMIIFVNAFENNFPCSERGIVRGNYFLLPVVEYN